MVNKILSLVVSSVVVLWGTSAFAGSWSNGKTFNGIALNGPGLVLQGLQLNGPGLVLQGLQLNGPGLVLQGLPTNGIQPNASGYNGIKLDGIVDIQESKQPSSDEKHLAQLMRKTEVPTEIVKLP